MANVKISALTELTAPAAGDYIPIVDISEAADADKTKRITLDALHYPVFLTTPLMSADFDGESFSTTAKTLIDLSTKFSAPAGISAIYMKIYGRDEASSGANCYAIFGPTTDASVGVVFDLGRVANDVIRYDNMIVPCNSDGDIYYQIDATGVGTFDLWMEIWGYWL